MPRRAHVIARQDSSMENEYGPLANQIDGRLALAGQPSVSMVDQLK
jgi:hypothetical protein